MANHDIVSAFDRTKMDSLPLDSLSSVKEKLAHAHAVYENRDKWLPAYERIEILERFKSAIKTNKEDIIHTAAKEGGKPLRDSRVEVDRGIDGINVAISEMRQFGGKEIPLGLTQSSTNRLGFTTREPRGVVVGISAFNHPFNLIIHQVIPAIAAGCPVLIKPARDTPLSCRSIVTLLHQAGLPPEWCQMFLCENDVTEAVVQDRRVAFLTFIGSAKVGWKLRSCLPPGAACTLEHGGIAPVIFDKSAKLSESIPLLVKGGFYHAGQVCVSVQRVYVEESIVDDFSQAFVEQVRALQIGDPTLEQTDIGPLIRPKEVERVASWVDEAVAGGAKVLCGGERLSETCYSPTVLFNPKDDATISQHEVFGPVVNLYTYRDRLDAIHRANKPNVAFQAAVFSSEIDTALDTAKRLKAMAVMINDHTAFRVDWMPFGGYQESGLGIGGIGYTMREMSIEKLLVFRSNLL